MYVWVTSQVAEQLKTSQNDSLVPSLTSKQNFFLILVKYSWKIEIEPLRYCSISQENSQIVYLKYLLYGCRLKSVENFVFIRKFLCLVMNHSANTFWWVGKSWNRALALRVSFEALFKKPFDFCNYTTSR